MIGLARRAQATHPESQWALDDDRVTLHAAPTPRGGRTRCQSALKIDPGSAPNSDPLVAAASERAVTIAVVSERLRIVRRGS